MSQIKEYCGVFGIFNCTEAAQKIYYGLHALQHRGQESCGIATSSFDEVRQKQVMPVHKDFGLVLDVFQDRDIFLSKLNGAAGIGHNRYSTSGASDNRANIQPFVVAYRNGNIALAHNGNLSNAAELRRAFRDRGTLFQSTGDSELILHLIAQSRRRQQVDQIFDALTQIEGAFSLVMLTDTQLIAVRDPNGFRPLALGRLTTGDEVSYCVASETCAFDMIGADYIRDVRPGEMLVIDRAGCESGSFQSRQLPSRYGVSQCVFEYVYFSRPDSMIFGQMVDKIRRRIGKELAHDAPIPARDDEGRRPIVISVPDSSNTATLGYVTECQKLGMDCRFEIGLIRNHYVGRTFIEPGQNTREQKVRCKFNTVRGVLKDRIVVMVDDSIVRGTTARALVKMVREAGAREVHFRVASPPVMHPCVYGMDFPSREELVANRHAQDVAEVERYLGVDSLKYLTVNGLMRAVKRAGSDGHDFCNACFTGQYPVPFEEALLKEENES